MKLLRLLCVPFALIAVGIIRLIASYRLVRFGELWSSRLGHLVGNTECYLCEREAGMHPTNTYDIWCHNGRVASQTIVKKYSKQLHVWPAWIWLLVVKVNALFLGAEKHLVQSVQVDRDIYNLWEKYGPHIKFTKHEEKRGQKLLRSLGIPEGAKWVCLIIRDSAYMKRHFATMDYSYHDYRDSDISECMPAALYLVTQGYYVIRMGETVGKPFLVRHSKIIDYALHKKRGDFGQIYLGAKCAFCFGSSTGFMAIPQVFNRPVAIINYAPIEYTPTWVKGLVIWKHHMKGEKRLSMSEIVEAGVSMTTFGPEFAQKGVTLQDNTAQEILDVMIEMVDQLEGKLSSDESQREWWDKQFPLSMVNEKPLHGEIKIRVGREYLKEWQ